MEMRRPVGVLVVVLWTLLLCGVTVHAAAANTTALCVKTSCELANGTVCDRQTQRCPPCLDEFKCVAFVNDTTKCPQSTTTCTAEAISSLVQGHDVTVANTTTEPPKKKSNITAPSKTNAPSVAATKTATPSSAQSSVLAASPSESPSPSSSQPTSINSKSSSSSGSNRDLSVILMVFGIIIGVLLLLIAAILTKRQCEKQQFKHRQVAGLGVAQVPSDSSDNSDGYKIDVSPNACAYDSYRSNLDTIPMPHHSRSRHIPPPPHRPRQLVDGRKFAQPLNAPLRQHSSSSSSSSRHSKKSPPRGPTLATIPPSPPTPTTIRSDSSEEFQTMLSATTDWIDDFHADVTTRGNPRLLTSSSSTIPILSHLVSTESTDSHDDIDIYPDTTDSYPDTESLHTGGTEGRMFSPASSRRQDSFYGIDL